MRNRVRYAFLFFIRRFMMADYPEQTNEHEINYDDDPLEYLKFQQDHLRQQLNYAQGQLQQTQTNAFMDKVNYKVQEFETKQDDYAEALTYLTKTRREQLTNSGVSDPVKQDQQINSEAWDITQTAMSKGENPAEIAYSKAKAEGYQAPFERDAFDALDDTEIDDKFDEMAKADYEETGASAGVKQGW